MGFHIKTLSEAMHLVARSQSLEIFVRRLLHQVLLVPQIQNGAKNTSCRITIGDGDRDKEKVSTTKDQEEAHCCKLTEGKNIDEDGVSHQDSVRSDAPCSEVPITGDLREETASSGAAGAKNTNTGSSGADGAKNTSCRITIGDGDRDKEKVSTTKDQEEAYCCKLTEGKNIDDDGVSLAQYAVSVFHTDQ
ncbi:hypothetical protein Ancab_003930 [Ancistrocladus abbreviatus]